MLIPPLDWTEKHWDDLPVGNATDVGGMAWFTMIQMGWPSDGERTRFFKTWMMGLEALRSPEGNVPDLLILESDLFH